MRSSPIQTECWILDVAIGWSHYSRHALRKLFDMSIVDTSPPGWVASDWVAPDHIIDG